MVYTAITFAPVQGFIEKSRKLRDLYGSSFILSFLSRALCDAAQQDGCQVVSPALINVTQGTPNQIVLNGDFPEAAARSALAKAWQAVVDICREEVERRLPETQLDGGGRYTWKRVWDAWGNHAWEIFHAQGKTITDARERLNEVKRSRAWTGINWHGESSTLSGADAIAWYGMAEKMHPKDSAAAQYDKIKAYCRQLSTALPNTIIDETEQLSIPELIKRVLMLKEDRSKNLKQDEQFPSRFKAKLRQLHLPDVEPPNVFTDINRFEEDRWTGWFQGDGDRIGNFLRSKGGDDPVVLNAFSKAMLDWGQGFQAEFDAAYGRVIYAGGDDFLGVHFSRDRELKLTGRQVLTWFYGFPKIWERHEQEDADGNLLTVSVGLVWAAPNVPQRDVLQHCKEAEQAAKRGGRDRLCIRILFNGGNYLEWICPWWFLAVMRDYRDRSDTTGENANWGHFFKDVATLEARHAFANQTDVAIALFEIYFGTEKRDELTKYLYDNGTQTGILRNQPVSGYQEARLLNEWICNLAKVGFHLHRQPNAQSAASLSQEAA
ncbi:Cas10/Cmr2 second palm domain-containing protein [Thermoleptolyngbya sp.]